MELTEKKIAYGIKEAAQAVGLSRSTIWEALKNQAIKSFKIGSRRLIMAEDLQAWLASYRDGAAA